MKAALIALGLAAVSMGGVGLAGPAQASTATKVKFSCGKGQTLRVVFKGNKAKVTPHGGEAVLLTQKRSGDGFLYGSSKYSLRGKGDRVTWTAARAKPLNCRSRS